jgi:uncharacterized OsmC-like protein
MSASGVVNARYSGGDAFRYTIRDHIDVVDQPVDEGGDDRGPTPTELLVASLVTCMGHYAQRFLRRNDIAVEGLELTARFEMSPDRPARVANVEVDVALPGDIPAPLLAALERVINSCTVHNTLHQPPEISLTLKSNEDAA